jgi:hypothetical protein
MRRFISMLAAGFLLAALPATAGATVPAYNQVIVSRSADAALVAADGCIITEIFVSASDAVYGGRPGPVNKQGLTGVGIRRTDVCTAGGASLASLGLHAAGGGGGGVVVFDGLGSTLDALGSTSHFDEAWLRATLPVVNEVTAEEVTVTVDLEWSLVGELDRDTGHSHIPPQLFDGTVNSHWNSLMGEATVRGTVTIGTQTSTFANVEGAHLQQLKYGCQVIVHDKTNGDLDCS